MKLLTKELLKKLPALLANDGQKPEYTKVIVKFFTPDAQCTWYITEFDGKDTFFGFCNLGDDQNAELGNISLKELQSIRGNLGLPVEREQYWNSNTTLDKVMNFEVR